MTGTVLYPRDGHGKVDVALDSDLSERATMTTTNPTPELSDTTISSSHASTVSSEERQRRDDSNGQSPSAAVLTLLARQLEYYFSTRNLSRDTYVQTLRSLNDGCVPVSILASFSKVKAIVNGDDEARFHAILQATNEYSDLLKVSSIETATGKITTDDTPSSATTILAIGPAGNEPLVLNEDKLRKSQSLGSISSYESSPGASTNTIILREVHPEVTEEEVRELFNLEGCPAIECIWPDVASCWFVTLDATCRDDMLRVMMSIRMQTLRGDYVQARLKATAAPPAESAPPLPIWPAFTPEMLALQESGAVGKKKKKKKKKNRRKSSTVDTQSQTEPAKGSSDKKAPPPPMSEDEFPTIQVKKVEFVTMPKDEKTDDEEDRTKSLSSDAASTATTTSSSLDSFARPKPFTGYAAALLKTPSPVTITEPPIPQHGSPKNLKRHSSMSGTLDPIADSSDLDDGTAKLRGPAMATPPVWGRGRSFADVLRENTAQS